MRKRLPRERWDEVLKSEACFDPGLEAAVTNSSRRRNLSCSNFSSANETLRTKRPAREPIAVAVILIAGFLIRFPGMLSNGFLSDESIYAYAAYAIGRGVTPYSQIMLAHPPIGYLVLIPSALLAQGNLLVLRTFNLSTRRGHLLLALQSLTIAQSGVNPSFAGIGAFCLVSPTLCDYYSSGVYYFRCSDPPGNSLLR